MSATRRGFLALVSGSTVTGSVLLRKAATAPTLILPPTLDLAGSVRRSSMRLIKASPSTGYPLLDAILASGQSQMHAFIDVKAGVPDDLFLDWLEGGLRMVKGCRPGGNIHRGMQMEGRM